MLWTFFYPTNEHVVISNVQTAEHWPGIGLPLWVRVFVCRDSFSEAHTHVGVAAALSHVCVLADRPASAALSP